MVNALHKDKYCRSNPEKGNLPVQKLNFLKQLFREGGKFPAPEDKHIYFAYPPILSNQSRASL